MFTCSLLSVPDSTLCYDPHVPNARLRDPPKDYYRNENVVFECNNGYEFSGHQYATCGNGNWQLPNCKYPHYITFLNNTN